MSDDLPGRWEWGSGEASRPLSNRGYYVHWAYRPLWENQHKEVYFEMRIDTLGMPPEAHVLQVSLREQTDEESYELERIANEGIRVIDRDRRASQRWAEKQIHEFAEELMARIEAQLQHLDSSTMRAARKVKV